jgi:SAM-dependent methyltransferase
VAHDLLDTGAAQIERARRLAEKRYNETLVALDQAVQRPVDVPVVTVDPELERLNATWNTLDGAGGGVGGRVRRLLAPVLRVVLGPQRVFNATLVAHLNRQAEVSRALAEALRQHVDAAIRFESHVVWYAQTVAGFLDTRDRGSAGLPGVDTLHAALNALADDWMKRWESLAARESRYASRHDSLAATHGELRDVLAIVQQNTATLRREVERLLAATGPRPAATTSESASESRAGTEPGSVSGTTPPASSLASATYVGFEDRFRGSPDVIRARLESYLPLFAGVQDVVEIGCGRGEFLDLLRGQGIRARGVDTNHEMVEVTRERGLDAANADGLSFLAAQPDASLGAVFAAQVVEHLEPPYLTQLIDTAAQKLRPGGLLVLETINAACWSAFFDSYLRDLTHARALHPDTLQYLVRAAGLHDVAIEFRSPIPEADRLQAVPLPPSGLSPTVADLIDAFNANVNRLNARLFTHQDYAVIGRK